MKDKIQAKINKKNWKFHELLKLKDVAKSVADELYHELNLKDQLELVWEVQLDKTTTFGSLFKSLVTEKLEEQVMIAFQDKFESATVNFSDEISDTPLVPVEKPASLADKYGSLQTDVREATLGKDLMEDLVKGKDVDMQIKNKSPSLKEKDGQVQTRLGNVKVKRVGGNGL